MSAAKHDSNGEWKKTACILCSLNCGLEMKTGGEDGREILKVRGDKEHPNSEGYICNKAARLNYYQTGKDRISTPMRRKSDGSYEAVSWDTAITEVAANLAKVRDEQGGDKILYYGGGGQGNHLGGAYTQGLLKALGVKYRANALSQEKTGEFWVNGKMFGTGVHGDFEHCEVAVFIGKNPWQSHGFARSRDVINAIKKDPARKMIVIDPRRSETAAKADYHLALKPGTDAWCLAAMVATIVQEDLLDHDWVEAHTMGADQVLSYFEDIDVAKYAEICGVGEELIRAAARTIAESRAVSVFEDLGMQQTLHSTLNSYLQRFLWLLTGNFAKKGANNAPIPFFGLNEASKSGSGKSGRGGQYKQSPVLGSKVIIGLIPCNNIPDEILADHPDRFRALIVESGNPVHSLADSQAMRKAMRALDFSVVIDVAMTETARQADYVLPAASQFEKYEATFFNLEFPRNAYHLRHPLFEPLEGTITEPEIHTRLLEALGVLKEKDYAFLKPAAKFNRALFASLFFTKIAANKSLMDYAANILYRTLGPSLPNGADSAAALWALSHMYVRNNKDYAAKAGFKGLLAGEKLFEAILNSPSGVVYADAGSYEESLNRVRHPGGRVNLYIPELLPELESLKDGFDVASDEFPLVLSAGERRGETTNTIIRSPEWDRKNLLGALRISPVDAEKKSLSTGDAVRVTTEAGSLDTFVEVTDMMQQGHISLPNGTGLDYQDDTGEIVHKGAAPNELTLTKDKDFLAGTPWHKFVPAKVEVLA